MKTFCALKEMTMTDAVTICDAASVRFHDHTTAARADPRVNN
jgi:hypothetical protein